MADWYFEKSGGRDGPHSDDAMIALARDGTIRDQTLVWTTDYGATWKPFAQSILHPFLRSVAAGVPALPTTRVSGAYAWVYAVLPLIGAIVEQLIVLNTTFHPSLGLIFSCYGGTYCLLAYYDSRAIERSGNAKVPDKRWFLLAPAYLWARARALGEKQVKFAIMLACFLAAVLLDQPGVRGQFFLGISLPQCSSTYATDEVTGLFATIPSNKITGVSAIDVNNLRQTGQTQTIRYCAASVLASDSETYNVTYSFEKRLDDVYVRIQVQ